MLNNDLLINNVIQHDYFHLDHLYITFFHKIPDHMLNTSINYDLSYIINIYIKFIYYSVNILNYLYVNTILIITIILLKSL